MREGIIDVAHGTEFRFGYEDGTFGRWRTGQEALGTGPSRVHALNLSPSSSNARAGNTVVEIQFRPRKTAGNTRFINWEDAK